MFPARLEGDKINFRVSPFYEYITLFFSVVANFQPLFYKGGFFVD